MLPIIAKRILVSGPARETSAMSLRPSFRLKGSIGTGLAPPRTMYGGVRYRISGRIILMNGSICFMGFSVSLPMSLAVGSPSR